LHLDTRSPHVRVERQLFKAGIKPFVQYEELRDRGVSKTEIVKIENALATLPKRKSRRAIPLVPLAVAALKYWKTVGWHQWVGFAAKADDAVFPGGRQAGHEPSNRFSVVASPGLLRLDLGRLGLPTTFEDKPLVFHSLRHTFATMLEAVGVERSMIGDLLGHKAKGVARAHYIAPLLEARATALQKLPLPETLRLKGVVVHADGHTTNDGKVIVLRDRAPRDWLRKRKGPTKRAVSRREH
jgi:integrase